MDERTSAKLDAVLKRWAREIDGCLLGEEAGDQVLEFLVESGLIVWPAKGELMLTELGLEQAQELERGPNQVVVGSPFKTHVPRPYLHRRLRPALGHLRAAQAGEAR